jgi:hypothetical protein
MTSHPVVSRVEEPILIAKRLFALPMVVLN